VRSIRICVVFVMSMASKRLLYAVLSKYQELETGASIGRKAVCWVGPKRRLRREMKNCMLTEYPYPCCVNVNTSRRSNLSYSGIFLLCRSSYYVRTRSQISAVRVLEAADDVTTPDEPATS
jgi:hypothetical protein